MSISKVIFIFFIGFLFFTSIISEGYPILFQYKCYYHPFVNGSTTVCPIPPTNCSSFRECRREMNMIFKSTPFVGLTPTKFINDDTCALNEENKTYFKLFRQKNLRFCDTSAGVFSSDLICGPTISCVEEDYKQKVCNAAKRNYFIIIVNG